MSQTDSTTDDAEQRLRRVLAQAPDDVGALANLGVLLCQRNRAAEGVELLGKAVQLQPDAAALHYNLANALRAAGRDSDAATSYRAALAREPGLAPAHNNLGNALLALGRPDEAAAAYLAATELRRGPDAPQITNDVLLTHASRSKLRHDLEQFDYLLRVGAVDPAFAARTAADYNAMLDLIPTGAGDTELIEIPGPLRARVSATYGRLWRRYDAPRLPQGALNPNLDIRAIEADYRRNGPGITHVDNLLRPEAIAELRRFCLESSFWFHFKYPMGYIGAFMETAFWCPLLGQVADELRRALPGIFGDHPLRKGWAYKYDSRLSGIPMHADFAAVNVNFWITPDDANRDPAHGGLVVWDKEAPRDWDFNAYNRDLDRMQDFVARAGARAVTIPHRQNRAVIFNSDLFHATDRIDFADGYENRRINITLLYGVRGA